jgi:ferritin-like metal-binding protein YciE
MNLHELVLENLQEVAGAEKFLVAGLLALIDASSGVQLQAALAEHLKQTEIQVTRIADVHTSLRLKLKSRICKPMVGLLADAAKATPTKPAGDIRDLAMLGAAERIEHFEIAVYFSLSPLLRHWGMATPRICLLRTSWKSRRPVTTGISWAHYRRDYMVNRREFLIGSAAVSERGGSPQIEPNWIASR